MTSRKVHHVVQEYVSSDADLAAIVRSSADSGSPTFQAIASLQESLAGRKLARYAIILANSAPVEGADADVLLLMLTSWADLSIRINRPAQAEALIQRARSLVTQNTPPEIRATLLTSEGLLADANGNKVRCESCLREAVKTINRSSPRYKYSVWNLAMFLAQQGRGTEFDADLEKLRAKCNDHFPSERIMFVRFVNAVETGDTRKAAEWLEDARKAADSLGPASRPLFRLYESLLGLMRGRADRSDVPSIPFKLPSDMPYSARAAHALLIHNTGEALRLARLDANRMLGSVFAGGFTSFSMARSELAAGNAEAARRLLELRHVRGNEHYLDDLFLSRILLLSGERDGARTAFLSALKSCDYYHARGRLNFELMMACELTPVDLVEISRGSENAGPVRDPVRSKPQPLLAPAQGTPATASILVGESQTMRIVLELINRMAATDASVLITGETGTGKELVARSLHSKSPRATAPFVPVNCGAIAETLLDSELFGYERGAFTGADKATKGLFEEAGNGIIFLDEIGEISPRLQVALLRVLETGEIRPVGSAKSRTIRCRVIMATNANLEDLAAKNQFRKDLLFRLQRLVINIPPLRERRDDILPLARHFLDLDRKPGVHAVLADDATKTMLAYNWPGNVRELRNIIERMRLLHSDKLYYTIDDMDPKFQADTETDDTEQIPEASTQPRAAEPAALLPVSGDHKLSGRSQFRRLDTIRSLFMFRKQLTRSEIMDAVKTCANTATKDLKILIDEGFIKAVNPSKSSRSRYFAIHQDAEENASGTAGEPGNP